MASPDEIWDQKTGDRVLQLLASLPHGVLTMSHDIPGLVEGASDGAGLGLNFLKHLARTRLLLHLVDCLPPAPQGDPVEDVRVIWKELAGFSPELAGKERWLVINKIDLLDPGVADARIEDIVRRLEWSGPHYAISAISGEGTGELVADVMSRLETLDEAASGTPPADAESGLS